MRVAFDRIPAELRSLRRWVNWKYSSSHGNKKPQKKPCTPAGTPAKSNTPATWRAFDDVCNAHTACLYDGIGFVFTSDDGYVGVDLDDCFEKSGGLKTVARRIVDHLQSYTELSPSGNGLHVIIKARLPSGVRHKVKFEGVTIEVYSERRYFTMTGDIFECDKSRIAERQNELDALSTSLLQRNASGAVGAAGSTSRRHHAGQDTSRDNNIISALMSKANGRGAAFYALFIDGKTEAYDGDRSRADLALANMIAAEAEREPYVVDRIFRRSALMRSKWDESHYADGRTYGQMTVAKACETSVNHNNGNCSGSETPTPSTLFIFEQVLRFVKRFVVLASHEAVAITLWVLMTHIAIKLDCVPYLSITSAEKRCGKTRLLEILALIVARPWFTGRTSAAVLVRKINAEHPTLLLDESDTAFQGSREYAETLRGVLNTGYVRSGTSSLCIARGRTYDYVDFSTFCPKAIAGIGSLPDTVADRSIPIRLTRRVTSEPVERMRRVLVTPEASALREQIECWSHSFEPGEIAETSLPSELSDRAADICEPLLVIADACSADVGVRARTALIHLCCHPDEESTGVRLLSDIRNVFNEQDVNRIRSQELAERLTHDEESPWMPIYGQEFDSRRLAKLLKPFDIRPGTIRVGDETVKGYKRGWFLDAWARYLKGEPQEPSQRSHDNKQPDTNNEQTNGRRREDYDREPPSSSDHIPDPIIMGVTDVTDVTDDCCVNHGLDGDVCDDGFQYASGAAGIPEDYCEFP